MLPGRFAGGNPVPRLTGIVSGDGEVVGVRGPHIGIHPNGIATSSASPTRPSSTNRFVAITATTCATHSRQSSPARRASPPVRTRRRSRARLRASWRSRAVSRCVPGARLRARALRRALRSLRHQSIVQVCDAAVEEMRQIDAGRPSSLKARGDPHRDLGRRPTRAGWSNLVGNAHEHGRRSFPIVIASSRETRNKVLFAVTNEGSRIAPGVARGHLRAVPMRPSRGARRGLGLGLYIVKYISAKRHQPGSI